MPRLLFVINEAYFLLSHRLQIALAAQAAGFEVHFAAPSHHAWAPADFDTSQLRRLGFKFHVIPMSRRGMNPAMELRTFVALFCLYLRLKPDLVHHITIKPNIYGGIAARLAGVPAVVFAVTGLGEIFSSSGVIAVGIRAFTSVAMAMAFRHPNARIIFQTPEDAEVLRRRRVVDPARIVIIRGAGVDLAHFTPTPEPEGTPLVVLPARLIWDKGIAEFVEAARLVRKRGIPARFVLVGGTHATNPRSVPIETLRRWEADGALEWWGYRNDMAAVLASSHIVCLPSSYGEGVPKVLLEAAAAGRPIIASDVPGCRQVVTEGQNGLLVPMHDPKALADAVAKLAVAPELRRAMGASGRQRAEDAFDELAVARETMAVYSSLVP